MLGQPYGKSDDRQGRVGVASRWEYRTACDVQAFQIMDSAIGVDNTVSRIERHSSGAHVVRTPVELVRPDFSFEPVGLLDFAPAQTFELGCCRRDDEANGFSVECWGAPLEPRPPHPQLVGVLRQHDTTIRIGRLLGARIEMKRAGLAFWPVSSYETSPGF